MVYRLVGGVYLMITAGVQANVLWLLNLMDACVRILIGVARSVEVTPDKLARRYPEVGPTFPASVTQPFPSTVLPLNHAIWVKRCSASKPALTQHWQSVAQKS